MTVWLERLHFIADQPERVARWRREWHGFSTRERALVRIEAAALADRHKIEPKLAALAATIRRGFTMADD